MKLTDKKLKLSKSRLTALQNLGLETVEEALSYYPFRYEILESKPFSEWQDHDKVAFTCTVISAVSSFRKGNLTISRFSVLMDDMTLHITVFNRPWLRSFPAGQVLTIQGIFSHPSTVTVMNYHTGPIEEQPAVTPVYSVKTGMQQRTVRAAIMAVYDYAQNEIPDIVPERYISAYRLLRKSDALRRIHAPESKQDVILAQRTLKYEEFLKFFTAIELRKKDITGVYKQPKTFSHQQLEAVIHSLPFSLTSGQLEALNDILNDMESTKPMYRLLQGDVGCGKTVVAALAMYAAVLSGMQAVLLVPTEILAQQHNLSLQEMFGDQKIRIAALYSGMKDKQAVKDAVRNHDIDILIGTHALLQEDVTFAELGLAVIDEQQRFGVEQRKSLRKKGENLDFLLMSATPIPRTLASTLYGDMEISTITTLPKNRKVPVTKYIPENSFRSVLSDITALLAAGQQIYVICAAIDENPELHIRNVEQVAKNLKKVFPEYRTGVLYGRLSSLEKQGIMKDFADHKLDILVSTTVVEVGMNVPNATGMIVYNAERFGLSQLHQLRGRIQRGSSQGYCWLLSDSTDDLTRERLNVLVNSNDGFAISYEDLRLRGPGDILGKKQSGIPDFILGNPVRDEKIVRQAQKDAAVIAGDPENPDFMGILDTVQHADEYRD